MFIGHFGLGLAAKKADAKPSLAILFLAAQFIDLLWPFFLLLGIEQVEIDPGNTAFTPLNFLSYPFSHSLAATLIWSLLFGFLYYFFSKNVRGSVITAILVLSHWVLDFLTHRPDLPLSFSESTKVGLGLWNHKALTIIVEVLIFMLGVYLYLKSTRAKNKTGTYAFWGLIVFLLLIYFMNVFGPPPPDAKAIGYVGLAQWLFIVWAYWVDKNRDAITNRTQ